MPPKKRAAKSTTAVTSVPTNKRPKRGVKVDEDPEDVDETKEEEVEPKEEEKAAKDSIITKLKEADKKSKALKVYFADKHIPNSGIYKVYGDYDCMLNQTNIGHNNNKFYVIQLLEGQIPGTYYCWNRWGRVGEIGQNNGLESFWDLNSAIKSFEKKFKDKTMNDWNNRDNFVPKANKYTLIEMDCTVEESTPIVDNPSSAVSNLNKNVSSSKLDSKTKDLIDLIFDKDMFKQALKSYDIDVKKMPLGKLSKSQIAKGFEVLEEIEALLKTKSPSSAKINELSSKFYTVIPQDFGRQRPPPINDQETLQKKYDMLMVLGDIELAQSMQENAEKANETTKTEALPNPSDMNYNMLKCKLELLDHNSDEFKIIDCYTKETKGWHRCEILDVWKVDRENEDKRFSVHDNMKNRKLLWHGTNIAVVVAILKTGLRIMPHSGGRVGKGIYFASENGKSACYVGTTNVKSDNIGIMFLNEVILGKEHHIFRDDPSLVQPPPGHDSVIARGMSEPDNKKDTTLKIEGKEVVVPQGKPINTKISSSFSQSEYLIYKESQHRIRYLLKMKF